MQERSTPMIEERYFTTRPAGRSCADGIVRCSWTVVFGAQYQVVRYVKADRTFFRITGTDLSASDRAYARGVARDGEVFTHRRFVRAAACSVRICLGYRLRRHDIRGLGGFDVHGDLRAGRRPLFQGTRCWTFRVGLLGLLGFLSRFAHRRIGVVPFALRIESAYRC